VRIGFATEREQRFAEFLDGREAVVRIARQRLHHDVVELLRHGEVEARRRRDVLRLDHRDRGEVGRAFEQATHRQHLVEHDAEAVLIRLRRGLLSVEQLGPHVADLPAHEAARLLRLAEDLCDAEVRQLHDAVESDQHVRERDVAMDDNGRLAVRPDEGVGVCEPGRDLGRDVHREERRE
jgi:hypothetical protein